MHCYTPLKEYENNLEYRNTQHIKKLTYYYYYYYYTAARVIIVPLYIISQLNFRLLLYTLKCLVKPCYHAGRRGYIPLHNIYNSVQCWL